MIILLLHCAALAADPLVINPFSEAQLQPAIIQAVEGRLASDETLLDYHRGYLRFLETHPDAAAAEEAYGGLLVLLRFGPLTGAFEEALMADSEACTAWDQYTAFLAEHRDARLAVDGLYRCELAERRHARTMGPAMAYLRAHPSEAMRYLDNPARLAPTPEALAPLHLFFKTRDAFRAELLAFFQQLDEQALAHARLYPWWRIAGDTERGVGEEHATLMAYFATHPHEFWVWHRRAIALAGEPRARGWIRYWYGLVRRDTALARYYAAYLQYLRQAPEHAKLIASRWEGEFGLAPAWPPEGRPPRLQSTGLKLHTVPLPTFQRRPAIPRFSPPPKPPRPAMPEIPARPERPEVPESPPRPAE